MVFSLIYHLAKMHNLTFMPPAASCLIRSFIRDTLHGARNLYTEESSIDNDKPYVEFAFSLIVQQPQP
jgi:hypothetical protein